METPTTPEGLAGQVEALWPHWVAHLADLAAGGQPAPGDLGYHTGCLLALVLDVLWVHRREPAAAAADGLWERVLGREEGGLLASVEALSTLLAAFQAQPEPGLERVAATHLAILGCITLLPGTNTEQQLGSRTPIRQALEQLCFKACPEALLRAQVAAKEHGVSPSPPYPLLADPSLPHQALLLGNALSCWRHCHEPLGLPSLLEELEWVAVWVGALDALAQAGALTGPVGDMHEALVLMCSRVLTDAGTDKPRQAQVMRSMQKDAWLLRWYTVELLRNVSYEIADAAFQGPRESYRSHWGTLSRLVRVWDQLRRGIAGAIAAHSQLQDLWLGALTAAANEAEEACGISIFGFSWTPPSKLHCWRVFNGAEFFQKAPTPGDKFYAMASFGRLHQNVHMLLLDRDAAAAQRTEAAAVAAARCCLRVARAVNGWQGERAATKGEDFKSALDAFEVFICAVRICPAFSCQATLRRSSTRIPGRRAMAAVIDMLQLSAEVLQAVVGMPALRGVRLHGFPRSLPAGLCKEAMFLGVLFLRQTLPGRQVRLTSCVEGEQVMPMVKALLGMLCAQRKVAAWLQGPGRTASAEASHGLQYLMESCFLEAVFTAMGLLKRVQPDPGGRPEGEARLAARWRVAVTHIALPAALVTHSLPVAPPEKRKLDSPWGFQLAWRLEAALDEGGSAHWSSVHAWAAWLMCACVRAAVDFKDCTPGEAAEALLSLLACIDVEAAPTPAVLTLLASGVFRHLARWAIRRGATLLEPSVAQVLMRLEQLLRMACRAADSLLLPGEEARFATANERPSKQIQGALGALGQKKLQSRKQLEPQGIASAVRGAWEQRRDRLLPPMERAARCGSAFAVTWQPAGAAAAGGGAETAAAAGHRHSCPLPAVQQALALAGVACANPLCTRLGCSSGVGEAAAGERLQRCRGCRLVGYCCAACGREDWERHRPACNALRHLRRGTASVRPVVGSRRA